MVEIKMFNLDLILTKNKQKNLIIGKIIVIYKNIIIVVKL